MITVELERLYMNEIGNLLADLSAAAAQLAACHRRGRRNSTLQLFT